MGNLRIGVNMEFVREFCKTCSGDIVLSVECGTVAQAERSYAHLKALL